MIDNEKRSDSKDKLILIIDDDENILELIEFIVKKEGFRVEKAADGECGLRKIQEILPNLVILDLMLPKYGGFEILRQLQTGETGKIPIIVITGRYTDRSTSDLIRQESNVVDFLEKPIKPHVLSSLLHKVLKTQPATPKKDG